MKQSHRKGGKSSYRKGKKGHEGALM